MNDRSQAKMSNPITEDVRALMSSKGVPKKEQSREVARILGLSISQAYKKFSGMADWSMAQIKAIEKAYGEPLAARGVSDGSNDLRRKAVDVTLQLGEMAIPAHAVIGAQYVTREATDFVAIGGRDRWTVVPQQSAPPKEAQFRVEYLEIAIKESRQYAVAVLDDDRVTADSVADALSENGFRATPFYQIAALQSAMEEDQFDAYVLDWKMGSETSENLIELIRMGSNSEAPICLLTGQYNAEREEEIVRVVRNYGVQILEKPIRMKLLALTIGNGLDAANKSD